MSNRQLLHNSDQNSASNRPPLNRPPIQWPTRSGTAAIRTTPAAPRPQSQPALTNNQRAADFARERVEQSYAQQNVPTHPKAEAPTNHAQQQASPTATTAANEPAKTMRQEPYNWEQYHSAWQQYYNQYFYRYYAGWWQQQKQQIEDTTRQNITPPTEQEQLSETEKVARELRQKVRSTVQKRAKKIKTSSHFKPLLAAGAVAITFLFINYNQVLVGAIKQYIAPGSVATTPVIVEPSSQAHVGPEPKIIIPKIGVEAPVVYDQPSVAENDFETALERGVVRLGNTADPGTKGNLVIGGHSSNNVFNPGKYKYVFVNLRQMDVGDVFYLNYNSVRYTYKVTVAKKIVSPTDVSVLAPSDVPMVTLFTCDPPGTNINRLIVQAVQIDPSPDTAPSNSNQPTKINKSNPLPSVAPSIWEKLFR